MVPQVDTTDFITRAYMSAKPILQTLVREATLASMVLGDSNLATLPLLD